MRPNYIPGMKLKGIGRRRNKAQLINKRDKKWAEFQARAAKKEREAKKHEEHEESI